MRKKKKTIYTLGHELTTKYECVLMHYIIYSQITTRLITLSRHNTTTLQYKQQVIVNTTRYYTQLSYGITQRYEMKHVFNMNDRHPNIMYS